MHDFVHGRCCRLRFDAPHTQQASPASHFVLLTTPPQHPLQTPYSTTPLLYFLLLPANCCNPKIVIDYPSIRQRVYIYLLWRALPRDLRVTTSTTPPTTGRKACHPPPPSIFAPDSASLGSPLLAAAHSHQHVLFRVAIGQDRPIGACLAGFQLGAQTHKAECPAVGSREQCQGYHWPGPGAHGLAFEWTVVAGCGQNLQQEG